MLTIADRLAATDQHALRLPNPDGSCSRNVALQLGLLLAEPLLNGSWPEGEGMRPCVRRLSLALQTLYTKARRGISDPAAARRAQVALSQCASRLGNPEAPGDPVEHLQHVLEALNRQSLASVRDAKESHPVNTATGAVPRVPCLFLPPIAPQLTGGTLQDLLDRTVCIEDDDASPPVSRCELLVVLRRFVVYPAPMHLIQLTQTVLLGDGSVSLRKSRQQGDGLRSSRERIPFELTAAVIHEQSHPNRTGHYYCLRRCTNEVWQRLDDDREPTLYPSWSSLHAEALARSCYLLLLRRAPPRDCQVDAKERRPFPMSHELAGS